MSNTPIKDSIFEYAELNPARFHMPGHKGELSPFDVTEISKTDDLQSPSGPILRSERNCAEVYFARDVFYLVNGSTCGNLAMMHLIGRGSKVLLDRGCHRSVISGAALCGVETVPLFPDKDGLYTPKAIAEALDRTPCKAVFITSPTYRGYVSDIYRIAQEVHKRGALLMVDSAHGAHYPFHDDFPPLPTDADMYCVSTHKTLFAMTQTAMLLANASCPFSRDEIQAAVNLFQSTSPSFELMLSIEQAVMEHEYYVPHLRRLASFKKSVIKIPGVKLLGSKDPMKADITRLNIAVDGMSGRRLAALLEGRGIFTEMADGECATFITAPSDKDEWYMRTMYALESISAMPKSSRYAPAPDESIIPGEYRISVQDAMFSKKERVLLEASVGRIAAEPVGIYPPGVATLFPGEEIGEKAVNKLTELRAAGAELFGAPGGKMAVVSEE